MTTANMRRSASMDAIAGSDALAATARDFADAMTPPGWIFSDPALYARDLDEIFGRMWLCVGHRSRLRAPGDFFRVDIGEESVLVVADPGGNANAFLNVCRHRGTRITNETSGRCRGFLCPYHAWFYDLDGTLKAAPDMDRVLGFDRADYPLVRVRLETFLGFLFINLDEDAHALGDAFADFPDFDRLNLPGLVRVARHDYDVQSNWKLICENYHECYHCSIAHPQLSRISDYGGLSNEGASGRNFIGGPMAIRPGFASMTMSGGGLGPRLTGADDADRRMVHYFNLLPNMLLSIAPDYVLTHYVWPREVDRVYIETEWFCSPEQKSEPGFDASDAIEFWDTTNRQDWALCENAMKGLRSRGHRPGRYGPGEDCAHRFDRWYVTKMFPGLGP